MVISLLGILEQIHEVMAEFRPYTGYGLILYGFIDCYLASRIYRYFMALTGFLSFLIISVWIPPEWVKMILLRYTLITLAGIILGAVFFFYRTVRISVKGAFVFLVLGAAFSHLFQVEPTNTLLLGLSILGAVIFIISDRGTRIVALAMFGSFLFLYGILLTWGWQTLQEMSFVFDVMNFDLRLFGFLIGWLLLFTTGVVFQTRLTE